MNNDKSSNNFLNNDVFCKSKVRLQFNLILRHESFKTSIYRII